jgi:sugar phosphate isomerase/epimerase
MDIKIFCPWWGHEHLDIAIFCRTIKEAGYDGIDCWIPEEPGVQHRLFDALQKHELLLVSHQHQAQGAHFEDFKKSFLYYLQWSAQGNPVLINSHTGRDYFSFEQNLALVDIAREFSEKHGVAVAHETHRGRMGFGPGHLTEYLNARPDLAITADFSHWVCVTESMLDNFPAELHEAMLRTLHVHARIGYEEGPQVPDPRAPEWKYAADRFLHWWDQILDNRRNAGAAFLGFTTEFGPPPYMPVIPFTRQPVADQFDINCYMKDLLRNRYKDGRSQP